MARIIEKITLGDVRACLDNLGANTQLLKDSDEERLLMILPADESFNHDVLVTFAIQGDENNWLKIQSYPPKFIVDDDDILMAYLIANKYNNYRRYGKLYIDHVVEDDGGKNLYIYEENIIADKPTTIECLEGNIIAFLTCAWELFSRFIKDSREDFKEMIKEK